MPLLKARSRATISSNIGEMLRSYQETGRIGNASPRNMAHAQRIAAAAAYSSAREAGARLPRRRKKPRRKKARKRLRWRDVL